MKNKDLSVTPATTPKGQPNGSETAPTRLPRRNYRAYIKLDFDALQYAEGEPFTNDFEFIKAFVISYNGKNIDDYKIVKTDTKRNLQYETARFSAVEKLDIMSKLRTLLQFETRKITAKVTQYYVVSVNQPAVEYEKQRAEFWAKKNQSNTA